MDRIIVLPGQVPLSSDMVRAERNTMIALGKLIEAVFGTSTLLHGFGCTPTSPASLEVAVAPGQVFSLRDVDSTPYGALAADIAHQIVKQGIFSDAVELSCPAPGTVGYSINYLVQIAFTETDTEPTLRTYYNAAKPSEPWSGPNNNQVPDATRRTATALVQVKAGVAAATGTQLTPSPDAGFVGAWVVTVANGQTQITSGDIVQYGGAPFATDTLQSKLGLSQADARYLMRSGGVMTGPITLSGAPINPNEPATKAYVDGLAAGIHALALGAVDCATTENIPLSGEQTIDGFVTSASRVLVKNQTTASQNGVYTSDAGAWTRTADADTWSEAVGALALILDGDTQAGSAWLSSGVSGGTLDTSAINWGPFFSGASFQQASALLDAIAALSTAGLIVRTGPGAVAARTLTAGAGVTVENGNGVAGNPTVAVDKASAANFRAGAANKMLDGASVFAAAQSVDLPTTGAVTVDMSAGINFKSLLTGNLTFNAPSNVRDGQSGKIELTQDSIGGRTASWHASWLFVGGAVPTLSTGANARDVLFFVGLADGKVLASLNKDVKR